jgi:hypothetical protein
VTQHTDARIVEFANGATDVLAGPSSITITSSGDLLLPQDGVQSEGEQPGTIVRGTTTETVSGP